MTDRYQNLKSRPKSEVAAWLLFAMQENLLAKHEKRYAKAKFSYSFST
jgi:hypothetical protein